MSKRLTIFIIVCFIFVFITAVFLKMHFGASPSGKSHFSGVHTYDSKSHGALKIDGLVLPRPRVIAPFFLTDDHGHAFTKANLRGHWTIMFFGFTNCGYVCPTLLTTLNKVYDQLHAQLPAGELPQFIMVSVDPERDTLARLHDYVQHFNPVFVGLRGSIPHTRALADQMSVVFSKVESNSALNYMVNHSAEIMMLNPDGNLQAFFSYPPEVTRMVYDYMRVFKDAQK